MENPKSEYNPLSLTDAITEDLAEQKERNSFQFAVLMALNVTGKHVYQGTVDAATKLKRRAAGKVAKASRKKNRNK